MLIRFNGKRQFRQIDALSKATTSIIDPSFPTPLTFYKRRAGDETWDETAPNIATEEFKFETYLLTGFWLGIFNLEAP